MLRKKELVKCLNVFLKFLRTFRCVISHIVFSRPIWASEVSIFKGVFLKMFWNTFTFDPQGSIPLALKINMTFSWKKVVFVLHGIYLNWFHSNKQLLRNISICRLSCVSDFRFVPNWSFSATITSGESRIPSNLYSYFRETLEILEPMGQSLQVNVFKLQKAH